MAHPPAATIVAEIGGDAIYPGTEFSVGPEAASAFVDADEGFLKDILGFARIAQHVPGIPKQRSFVTANQQFQGRVILVVADAAHEFLVRRFRCIGLMCIRHAVDSGSFSAGFGPLQA